MQEIATVIALIGACGSVILIIKFWMERGKAEQKADNAAITAQTAIGKCEILSQQLSDFKVESSRDFASFKALAAAEQRFVDMVGGMRSDVSTAVKGMRDDMNRLADRFDRFMERHRDDD